MLLLIIATPHAFHDASAQGLDGSDVAAQFPVHFLPTLGEFLASHGLV